MNSLESKDIVRGYYKIDSRVVVEQLKSIKYWVDKI